MLVEIHALQSFAPSNLNRDDTGNPKDVVFGGTRRMRLSSQAQKRPIRLSGHFQDAVKASIAFRTQQLVRTLSGAMADRGVGQDTAEELAVAFVDALAKIDTKNNFSKVLVYLSEAEHAFIVEQLIAAADAPARDMKSIIKNLAKSPKDRTSAPDLALFGRMLADAPELNVDAAAQVAHAISTHTGVIEFDYFTAVDDLAPKEQTGASMIGIVPFTSATYYRYARVDVKQLQRNLGEDKPLAQRTIEGFLQAFIYALPTGKQNTFAAHNLPEFVIGIVRPNNQGWSLANAFERPVRANRDGGGYMLPSIAALWNHWAQTEYTYGMVDAAATVVLNPTGMDLTLPEGLGLPFHSTDRVRDWLDSMTAALPAES